MVGRVTERRAVQELLGDVRYGRGRSLLITGEAGIGKTALLDELAGDADGLRVLRACGSEVEREVDYAGLHSLLYPLRDEFPRLLAPRQARILRSAIGHAEVARVDRLAVYAALLATLAAAADETPLLVMIDDAHWFDHASLGAMTFAARRASGEPIGFLLAARQLDRRNAWDLPELALTGLDPDSCEALLRDRFGGGLDPEVSRRLGLATGGNPLALLELPVLAADQLAGRAALPDPLPTSARLEAVFAARIDELPEPTQRALVLIATGAGDGSAAVIEALASERLWPDALEPAERAGLIRLADGAVSFRHPLTRSAVYQRATQLARRVAHRALADALGRHGDRERQLWHLAIAATEPDERVAGELERLATEAAQRGAVSTRATLLRRAARLTPPGRKQGRRLVQAGSAAWEAGDLDAAESLLSEALGMKLADAVVRAAAQHVLGRLVAERHDLEAGCATLEEAAEATVAAHPERAATILADAAWIAWHGEDVTRALALARRAQAVAPPSSPEALVRARLALGGALLASGDRKADRHLVAALRALEEVPGVTTDTGLVGTAAYYLVDLRDLDDVHARLRSLLDSAIAAGRDHGSETGLPMALCSLAAIDYLQGNWAASYAEAGEAVELAHDLGDRLTEALSLMAQARVEAAQGREKECRSTVERLRLAYHEIGGESDHPELYLGMLSVGTGEYSSAITHLRAAQAGAAGQGYADVEEPHPLPELLEATIRAGHHAEAETLLARLERAPGREYAQAWAASARGQLTGGGYDDHFGQALELVPAGALFPRARIQLAYGERLRRARRRIDARSQLGAALTTFEALGAEPWAERAHRELLATGSRRQRRDPQTLNELTPQETAVAMAIAAGATYRQAAQQLFLSPKTIEFHLRSVYRKLDITDRTELPAALSLPPPTERSSGDTERARALAQPEP